MKYIFSFFIVVLLFCSCGKDNPVENQGAKIDSYIKTKMSKNQGLKLDRQGSVFYLYQPGDTTVTVSSGDSVYFYYAAVLVTDTLRYFDTNEQKLAEALGLNIDSRNFAPAGFTAGDGKLLKGLAIGLQMTHPNDVGEIIFNSDFGFGNKSNGIVAAYSALIYKVNIIRIKKKQ